MAAPADRSLPSSRCSHTNIYYPGAGRSLNQLDWKSYVYGDMTSGALCSFQLVCHVNWQKWNQTAVKLLMFEFQLKDGFSPVVRDEPLMQVCVSDVCVDHTQDCTHRQTPPTGPPLSDTAECHTPRDWMWPTPATQQRNETTLEQTNCPLCPLGLTCVKWRHVEFSRHCPLE